jgi:glycosyltransferase involved in cell wall biosynthesis
VQGEYLLFFGRIHPNKGVVEAIQVARRVGIKLVIAGIIQDQDYFAAQVEPHINGTDVEYLGSVGPDQRADVLGRARALLHLISFEEPFGLSMVESMACGTPVIAYARGSIPEIVRHGENGYIVANIDAAANAIASLHLIDRLACRRDVERRFSHTRMARDYVGVYNKILNPGPGDD